MEPKNCTECKKRKTCQSWYGGCGCTEAPMTIFGPRIDRHNREIDRTPMLAAKLDYLSMMTGVDMPEELKMKQSPKFNTVKAYYDAKRWTRAMLLNAVGKWITEAEAEEILNAEEVT